MWLDDYSSKTSLNNSACIVCESDIKFPIFPLLVQCVLVIVITCMAYLIFIKCHWISSSRCHKVYRRIADIMLKILNYRKQDIFENDIFIDELVNPLDLKPGDHIFIPGGHSRHVKRNVSVAYFHHGIYLGSLNGYIWTSHNEEKMITDFGAVNKLRPVIRPFEEFMNGYSSNQLYRRNYTDQSGIMSPQETVDFAIEIIHYYNYPWSSYHLLYNNCEHYATFLKVLMKRFSKQVESSNVASLFVRKVEDRPEQYQLWESLYIDLLEVHGIGNRYKYT